MHLVYDFKDVVVVFIPPRLSLGTDLPFLNLPTWVSLLPPRMDYPCGFHSTDSSLLPHLP